MMMPEESREVRETRPVWEAEVPWVVAYLREDIQDLTQARLVAEFDILPQL